MTQLSDKLNRATKGSRELSDEVLIACGWEYRCDHEQYWSWYTPDGKRWLPFWRLPDPSQNLQDAVSLLKDGEEYEVSTLYGIAHVTLPLNTNDPDGPYEARREDGDVCLAFCECYIKASSKAEAA